jgi:hypothetical protein
MHELEKVLKKLLEDARKLPPGQNRHELLKDIGCLGTKIAVHEAKKASGQANPSRIDPHQS